MPPCRLPYAEATATEPGGEPRNRLPDIGLLRLLLIPGSTASRPGETWVYTGQIGAQNGISAFNANHEAPLVWPPASVRGVRTTFSLHFVSHACADTPSLAKPSSHPNGCCRTIGYSADSFDQVRCYCLA